MFGALTNLFVEVEEKKPAKRESVPPPATQTPLPTSAAISPNLMIGQFDPEIAKILRDAIEAANLPGYDYLEFRQVLSGMEHIPMTEQQKFQAAYAAAQAMKVSKKELISAAQHYLGVLDKKKQEFMVMVNGLKQEQVVARENEISNLEEVIKKDAAEIQRLTEAIQGNRHRQAMLTQEVDVERSKIQNTQATFEKTFDVIADGIRTDAQKIEALIPDSV